MESNIGIPITKQIVPMILRVISVITHDDVYSMWGIAGVCAINLGAFYNTSVIFGTVCTFDRNGPLPNSGDRMGSVVDGDVTM